MKYLILLLLTGCSSIHTSEDLCQQHKEDYAYFLNKFNIEHSSLCSGKNSCLYTKSMNHSSDEYERIAGIYYLSSCDLKYGRL